MRKRFIAALGLCLLVSAVLPALAQQAPVILLDEPTASLDLGTSGSCFRCWRSLTETKAARS